jgi:hypothetical protein
MRIASLFVLALFSIGSAEAITLYNGTDQKIGAQNNQASEQLNLALSKMFEVFAAVERGSFDNADSLKEDSAKQLRQAAELFSVVANSASAATFVVQPKDETDQSIVRAMEFYMTHFKIGKALTALSEKQLYSGIVAALVEFATQFEKTPMSFFASKDKNEKRATNELILQAIRVQDFGRVVTAYLSIPRKS